MSLQNSFEEPGRVADVPAWRAHEFGRLDYVILDLERRDNLHRARSNLLVEIRYRNGIRP